MNTLVVIRTGGKQYLAKLDDVLTVDRIEAKEQEELEVETLARFSEDGTTVEVGTPLLEKKAKIKIVEHVLGDKVRVARFKAKVRYRKVRGFRGHYTKVQVVSA